MVTCTSDWRIIIDCHHRLAARWPCDVGHITRGGGGGVGGLLHHSGHHAMKGSYMHKSICTYLLQVYSWPIDPDILCSKVGCAPSTYFLIHGCSGVCVTLISNDLPPGRGHALAASAGLSPSPSATESLAVEKTVVLVSLSLREVAAGRRWWWWRDGVRPSVFTCRELAVAVIKPMAPSAALRISFSRRTAAVAVVD